MKRVIAFIMALLMSIFLMPLSFASDDTIKCSSFRADKTAVKHDDYVTFSVKINANRRVKPSEVKLVNSQSKTVSYMYDDGTHSDVTAHDDIFSCKIKLKSDTIRKEKFYVRAGECTSYPVTVKITKSLTDADKAYALCLWDRIEKIEKTLAQKGLSAESIADEVFLMLSKEKNVLSLEKSSIKSVSFMLCSGIENYFEHREYKPSRRTYIPTDTVYTESGYIGVWSPYYGIYNDFTDSYAQRAHAMCEAAGYDGVDEYLGEAATLDSFKSFDKYGIIMIDSHGADYDGGGYICIPAPTDYDWQDLEDGLLVLSGSTMLLSGDFICKYTDELPNTIIYIGICHGLQAEHFYAPLLNHGASFVAGFDEAVSFTFDGIIMNDFCQRLADTNPDTLQQYTTGEAFSACIVQNGSVDTHAKESAHFVCYGNNDAVAAAVEIAVDDVSMDEACVLYHNNTYYPHFSVEPENANRYTKNFSSSDDDIATVDENGIITAGTTDGEAIITCTVTDKAGDEEKSHIRTCSVKVSGAMAAIGIETQRYYVETFVGERTQLVSYVLPYNASDTGISYRSYNDDIVTTDENGMITAVSCGDAYIEAKTHDGEYKTLIHVAVKEGDISEALNLPNGTLEFYTENESEPVCMVQDDRFCVKTSIEGRMNKAYVLSLNAGHLHAGDSIVFDWKVSCEAIYDKFECRINGELFDRISGERDWKTVRFTAKEEGKYVIKWIYQKDYSTNEGADCGWIDNVDVIRLIDMHKVTFTDSDGNVLKEQTVLHGSPAYAPVVTADENCLFLGWDSDFSEVRSDMTVRLISVVKGDGNVDGKLNTGDAVYILRICTDLTVADELREMLCDYNNDGTINTGDATAILKYLVGL